MASPQKSGNGLFPTAKIAALTRWKTLADSITPRRRSPEVVFPPPSWEIDKLVIDSSNSWERTTLQPVSRTPSREEAMARVADTVISTEVPVDLEDPRGPELWTFARKIRDLIESLPIHGSSTFSRQPTPTDHHEPDTLRAEDGTTGPPIPPGVDQEMVLMLSSEEVMNGEEGQGGKQVNERQSIWTMLSSMSLKGKGKEAVSEPISSPTPSQTRDGLMMYVPLEPTNDSTVELAEVHSLSEDSIPPFSPTLEQPARDTVPEDAGWVPSTTQISVYTTWWGYRLYLPPSVMVTLDSVSLKATAQAAMLTGALKWLLNKVPDMFVPTQFKPALMMLRRLSPVVGYIGVFVAWSWGRIKRHDKGELLIGKFDSRRLMFSAGNGVVLTATWLLPVALIPMQWDAGDIFGPVLLPKPEDRVPPLNSESDKESKPTEKKKRFWNL